MPLDLFESRISTNVTDDAGITKSQLTSSLMRSGFPTLYIESNVLFKVDNAKVTTENLEFSIIGLTMLEVVKKLRDNGISAYLARIDVGMLPAELLLDFSNESIFSIDIDSSPKRLSEIHAKTLVNIPGLDESSISREVISVYSINQDIKYGISGERNSYFIDNNMLYTNGLLSDTRAVVMYRANKFLLFASKENSIELSSALEIEGTKINNSILLETSTALNWNKV